MQYLNKLLLSLCLVMGLGAAMAARGQVASDAMITANIPYAFVVNHKQLPAGTYTIKVASQDDVNLLEIRSADGRRAVLFGTDDIQAKRTPGKTELVFDRVGDKYFLSQVFLKGDDSGNQLPKSRMERRLEESGLKPERHSVAADIVHAVKEVGKKIT